MLDCLIFIGTQGARRVGAPTPPILKIQVNTTFSDESRMKWQINTSLFLKLLYSKLEVDSMTEMRYLMSCLH